MCGLFGGLAVGKSSLIKALAGRHYNEQLHGLLTAAGSTVYLVDGAHRTLVLHEVRWGHGWAVGWLKSVRGCCKV